MPRGRKPGFRMTEEHRDKIRNSNILNALCEHVIGKREMSATQVTAGIALLRKIMPDLASIEHEGEVQVINVVSGELLTPEQWAAERVTSH